MTADFQKILNDFNQKDFAPVYFVDGEESYFIDLITHLFKTAILAPHDADFNLIELFFSSNNILYLLIIILTIKIT